MQLVEELDVIINCAASLSFHDPLKEAIQINYFSAVKMLQLAQECKKSPILSHVSTCYVGCNLPPNTFIEEKIQLDTHKEDFETQIKVILEMDDESVTKNTLRLCNGYVNTYSYTKNLAERYL